MNSETKKIIDILKEERNRKNISMNQMSKLMGVSHTTISRIEKGEMTPTIDMIISYASCLDYDIKLEKRYTDGYKGKKI